MAESIQLRSKEITQILLLSKQQDWEGILKILLSPIIMTDLARILEETQHPDDLKELKRLLPPIRPAKKQVAE